MLGYKDLSFWLKFFKGKLLIGFEEGDMICGEFFIIYLF